MSVPKHVYVWCLECNKLIEKYTAEMCEHVGGVRNGRSAAPIFTYFEGPDGSVSVPANEASKMPARLKKLGYEVKHIQDSHQYSQFCKKMDSESKEKHDRVYEAQHAQFEAQQKARREELRSAMRTEFGRDFLEHAIQESEKGAYGRGYDAGSHLEGFEYDGRRGHEE